LRPSEKKNPVKNTGDFWGFLLSWFLPKIEQENTKKQAFLQFQNWTDKYLLELIRLMGQKILRPKRKSNLPKVPNYFKLNLLLEYFQFQIESKRHPVLLFLIKNASKSPRIKPLY